MATVITDIVNAVEKAISDFESLIKTAIASLRSKGNEIANEIETVSKEIYTGFRSKCSAVIQDFKS